MDPPRDSPPFKAPGRTSSSSRQEARPSPGFGRAFEAPAAKRQDLPPIYERLARPETQEEYFHGQLRRKVPANPPHATQHFRLAYVLNAHVAEGYQGAVEMLTRTGRDTDFAPDASIFPLAPEDGTGERRLEELAFEVCSEQDLSVPTEKARELVGRGVRRVFCIVVGGPGRKRRRRLEKGYVTEWSRATDGWSPIPESGSIADECLATPMPVKALLDATLSDDAVVRALEARGNRAIRAFRAEAEAKGWAEGEAKGRAEGEAKGRAEGEAKGRAEGEAKGRTAALVSILEARGLTLTDGARQRILACRDPIRLTRWTRRALLIDSVDDLWND
jgi:hypothetical protein